MSRERIRVVPADGLLVRDPATKLHLPPEGADVERCSYWVRRRQRGEVTFGERRKNRVAKSPEKKKEG